MCKKDEAAIVAPLATLSLGELAQYAVEESLIDRFEIAGIDATIVQGNQHFRLPHRQASTFLIGMLRGRSWYVTDPCRGGSASGHVEARPAGVSLDFMGADRPDGRGLEATLDGLLEFAKDTGIIKAYRKEPGVRQVQIDIAACSSTFTYVEAVKYLLDCLRYATEATIEAA